MRFNFNSIGNILILMGALFVPVLCWAQDAQPVEASPEPVLNFIGQVIIFLQGQFPAAGKYIQLGMEIIASIGTFFTLAAVFVTGVLKIPVVVARVGGAHALADKIQKFHDKVIPYLKYFSIFNVQKK